MYQDRFKEASLNKREIIKLLTELGESEEIKEIVTRCNLCPIQSLNERYEYVKTSVNEGNFEIFKRIAKLIGDTYTYRQQDRADDELACVYYGNDAYDFELILSLARFYQKNKVLFKGHFDIISKMCNPPRRKSKCRWEELKDFWLEYTINQ